MITISLLKETFSEFMEDKAMRLSAALAYYSVFSLGPLLVISISIAGAVFGEDAAQGAIKQQLTGSIGSESALAVQEMIESVNRSGSNILRRSWALSSSWSPRQEYSLSSRTQ